MKLNQSPDQIKIKVKKKIKKNKIYFRILNYSLTFYFPWHPSLKIFPDALRIARVIAAFSSGNLKEVISYQICISLSLMF